MNVKKFLSIFLVLVMLVAIGGCGKKSTSVDSSKEISDNNQQTVENKKEDTENAVINEKDAEENLYPDYILEETDTTITYLDPRDNKTTITKKPKKVVILLNSILDLWYMSGGEAIGRCTGSTNVPEEAKDLPQLGKFSAVNVEQLLALEPDLVILSAPVSSQMELIDLLKENNIEYAAVDVSTNPYESFKKNLYLFTKVLGNEDIYNNKISEITNSVEELINKANEVENKPSAVILFSSTKSVKCELPTALTGEMVELLGVDNIVSDAQIEGATKVDFSLERLIQRDPDFILVTTMGDVEKCKARVEKDVASNEAWNSLTAVKEGRIYYLPKDLFLYKPNARYAEAFEQLAKILYPEVFNQ